VIARVTGGALLVFGVAIAALPAFVWFTAPPAATPTEASGFAASGQLWLLPVLGAFIALAGAGLLRSGPGTGRPAARWAGPLALVSALGALGLAVWAAADPAVALHVSEAGGSEIVPAPVSLAPAAFLAPIAAGAAALVGAATTWVGRQR
jgi:hypothetical protein